MKRKGRADEVHATVSDPGFRRRLSEAVKARGNVPITGHDVRALALKLLPDRALDGVKVTFQWDAEARKVGVLVKGTSTPAEQQTGARP